MPTKTCTKCGDTKPLDDFHRQATGKQGRRSNCKACAKTYRAANHDAIKAKQRAYYHANRDKLLAQKRDERQTHTQPAPAPDSPAQVTAPTTTAPPAAREHSPWADHEDDYILTTTDTSQQAALKLGRTYISVRARKRHLLRIAA